MFLETSTFGKNLGRNGSAFATLLSTFPFLVIALSFLPFSARFHFLNSMCGWTRGIFMISHFIFLMRTCSSFLLRFSSMVVCLFSLSIIYQFTKQLSLINNSIQGSFQKNIVTAALTHQDNISNDNAITPVRHSNYQLADRHPDRSS